MDQRGCVDVSWREGSMPGIQHHKEVAGIHAASIISVRGRCRMAETSTAMARYTSTRPDGRNIPLGNVIWSFGPYQLLSSTPDTNSNTQKLPLRPFLCRRFGTWTSCIVWVYKLFRQRQEKLVMALFMFGHFSPHLCKNCSAKLHSL